MVSYITLAPQCVPLALASSSSLNPLGGIVFPFPLLLVIGVVSVANPQTLELMLSPLNPFGGFTKWLLLCLGGSPPCLIVQSNGDFLTCANRPNSLILRHLQQNLWT